MNTGIDFFFYLVMVAGFAIVVGIILLVAAIRRKLSKEYAVAVVKIALFLLVLVLVFASVKDLWEHNSAYPGSIVILVIALFVWVIWSVVSQYELSNYRKRAQREQEELERRWKQNHPDE